jgi:hypothetical protein
MDDQFLEEVVAETQASKADLMTKTIRRTPTAKLRAVAPCRLAIFINLVQNSVTLYEQQD